MEINNKFLNTISNIEKLNLAKNVKETLIKDIKELRDKVFNTITDTKEEEPLAASMQEEFKKKHDNVNHPSHYAKGDIECIDAMEAAYGTEAVMHFCQCNAFKYQWRFDKKNGEEDIKKAQWYQNRYMKLDRKLKNNG